MNGQMGFGYNNQMYPTYPQINPYQMQPQMYQTATSVAPQMTQQQYQPQMTNQTMQIPIMQQNQIPQEQVQLPMCKTVEVIGYNGADAYGIAPGSDILLRDKTSPYVYYKTVDENNNSRITLYRAVPFEDYQDIDFAKFDTRLNSLEEAVFNGKPNASESVQQPISKSTRTNKTSV